MYILVRETVDLDENRDKKEEDEECGNGVEYVFAKLGSQEINTKHTVSRK
jgi:hypothetical protein